MTFGFVFCFTEYHHLSAQYLYNIMVFVDVQPAPNQVCHSKGRYIFVNFVVLRTFCKYQ